MTAPYADGYRVTAGRDPAGSDTRVSPAGTGYLSRLTKPARALALLVAACALCVWPLAGAAAAPRAAVFPIELVIALQQDDIMGIPKKATPEEVHRIEIATEELRQLLKADGRYEIVDIAPLAEEIEKASPLHECNGCAVEITQKLGAQFAITGIVRKASATLLTLSIYVIDTQADPDKSVRSMSVTITGNTDNAWLRGVRWLVKNRLAVRSEGSP